MRASAFQVIVVSPALISFFSLLHCRYPLNREGALKCIVDSLKDRDVVVGTTGMLSRELFEYRIAKGHGHEKDFLTVGSMGHASAIALGIAQFRPKRQVTEICLLL